MFCLHVTIWYNLKRKKSEKIGKAAGEALNELICVSCPVAEADAEDPGVCSVFQMREWMGQRGERTRERNALSEVL